MKKEGTMTIKESRRPVSAMTKRRNAAKKRVRDAEDKLNAAKLELEVIELEATIERFIAGTIQLATINAENERLFQLAHWHKKRGEMEKAEEYVAKTVSP
jgi:hypothetical protein